jgi:hypothetical protein
MSRLSFPLFTAGLLHREGKILVHTETEPDSTDQAEKNGASETSGLFDITKQWEEATKEKADFLRKLIQTNGDQEPTPDKTKTEKQIRGTGTDSVSVFSHLSQAVSDAMGDASTSTGTHKLDATASTENYKDMSKTLLKLLVTGGGSSTVEDIVSKARNMDEQGDVSDKVSLSELLEIVQLAASELNQTMSSFLGEDSLPALHPSNLFYFVEREDEKKNPSSKRRKHRFFSGVGVEQVDDLNEKLRLALLSYTGTLEEVQTSLEKDFNCELAYCAMESLPGKPSHFIAVKKDQSQWSSSLELLLVVRGTKTITDVITDLLCDADPYRGGLAHVGITQSGQYLANKHDALFRKLLELSGKKKIKLTLIGHSLGAGAASIAGIELQDQAHMDVEVIGFGCPALLSKDLSEKCKAFITTVVADDDCIPRMSKSTMSNSILDIGGYNWIPYVRRDIEHAVDEVQRFLPRVLTDTKKKKIMSVIHGLLPGSIPPTTSKRMEPVLFPPGKCIHFYRDGFGISGNEVPCTFFNEINFSRRMIHDHLFQTGYQLIFLDLMRQHHNDHYFRFDIDKTPV